MRIGVFDSGVGGITVLNELKRQFPQHEYLYFGDTANVPYGTKSNHQIQALVNSACERIKNEKPDALVIACNTASAIAYENFKTAFDPIPLIDVVEAGVSSVMTAWTELKNTQAPILVFGTRATIRSRIYSNLIHEEALGKTITVFEQECPLLVPLIEEGWTEHPVLKLTVEEYVRPYLANVPGVALLACTHYPWVKNAFESLLPNWKIIDSAHAVSEISEARLKLSASAEVNASGVLNPQTPPKTPAVQWHFSDPDSVQTKFFQLDPKQVKGF